MTRVGTFPKESIIANRYQVQTYLGEHDCCEVYRVVDIETCDLKLLKIIQNKQLPSIDLDLLEKTLLKYSKLRHQNLIIQSELKNFIDNQITYYYFLNNYISGEPLEDLLRRKLKLSIFESSEILFPILDTLDYLHSQKIMHKNINPSYIYLDYSLNKINSFLCLVKVSEFSSEEAKKIYLAYQSNNRLFKKNYIGNDVFSWMIIFYKSITGVQPWNYDIDWEIDDITSIRQRIELHRASYSSTPLSFYESTYEKVDNVFKIVFDKNCQNLFLNFQELKSDLISGFNLDSKYQFLKMINKKESNANFQIKNSKIENKKGLQKIAGMDDLKQQLDIDVIQPLIQKDKYQKYGVEPLTGILLYGPPGCGKTFIAQCLAEEIGYSYFEIKPSDLASVYIHGTQEKIAKLFRKAEESNPSLIFIDEIDALLPNRSQENLTHHYASEVNEFLSQITNCGEKGILVIGATNRPKAIDPAMLRTGRLEKHIYIDFPDFNARLGMLKQYLENRPCSDDLDLFNLAILMVGYTSSGLRYIVNETAKLALKEDCQINDIFFKTIIEKYKPSVRNDDRFSQF